MKTFEKYQRALILGTGGGNDIVSACLIGDYLTSMGIVCDVAGIASPGALHSYSGVPEGPINILAGEVKRYIDTNPPTEISFIDAQLPEYALKHGYLFNKFYNFSLMHGTDALVDLLNSMIEFERYDVFIEVDVGGDILGTPADKHLLSPMMDFSSLHLLDKVNIDSYLVEFGLGTDGELRADRIESIIDELRDSDMIHEEFIIKDSDSEINRFKNLFEDISKTRRGHTATMTLKTLQATEDIETQYYSTWKLGEKVWKNYFDVVLPKSTFGKAYIIDGKRLPAKRPDTSFGYSQPLEQFLKLKEMRPEWKTELDMCVYSGTLLLTPSLHVPEDMRKEIIAEGLEMVHRGEAMQAILLSQDEDLCNGKMILQNEHFGIYNGK